MTIDNTPHQPHEIFVFGSNLAGRHGAGAALYARKSCGAWPGVGFGRHGMSYAIPTKDENIKTLPLQAIRGWCWAFIEYAKANHDERFYLTPIGTGLAGYTREQIAPFFVRVPLNVRYAHTWYDQP